MRCRMKGTSDGGFRRDDSSIPGTRTDSSMPAWDPPPPESERQSALDTVSVPYRSTGTESTDRGEPGTVRISV